ncbi:MAG: GNAT family N-acetyltransferase [Desulfurococcales archaeon]|nr:GNAT family N-acetyltransferase [Desulfurococcales archaeon]
MAKVNITIDRIRKEDVSHVLGIIRGLPEWFILNAVAEIKEAAKRLPGFVARVGDVVRGFIILEERECCVEIAWLAVEKGFQGRGLGTLLLRAAESYACSKGKPVLTVKTYGGMDYEPYLETLAFYKKKGFKLYEVVEEYKPFNGQPAAILIKTLDCRKPFE